MVAGVDITDRGEIEDSAAGHDLTALRPSGPFRWLHRLAPTRLTSRIIIINFAGLIILVGGILYFNQSRQSLIDARVQSLMTQARIMSAAVAAAATIDTDQIIVDPEQLLEMQLGKPRDSDEPRSYDFLINPERSGPVLRRLAASTDTRARIFDREGMLVVDSRYLYGRGEILRFDLPPPNRDTRKNWLNGTLKWLYDLIFAHRYPLQKDYGFDNGKDFPEVTAALNGASVSVIRVNDRNEIIVSVAVPIQRFRAVLGGLVLSTNGGEIDTVLRNERRIVLLTFAVAGLVTILLAIALAGHIAEPVRRLAAAAEHVRRGVNNRVEIPDFTFRRDEIGHLSGALRDMTGALYKRIDAIEAFAADVSHELKNPLTSLRSAVETFHYARTGEQRQRLIAIIKDDVRRLDRLISDISDASRLDAELARAKAAPVSVDRLLAALVDLANEVRPACEARIVLQQGLPPQGMDAAAAFKVLGHDNRLGQVVSNLIDNALSFSASGSTVTVNLRRRGAWVELHIDDEGPGVPSDNLERIFQRFYTDRPEGSFGKNSGLGLSISRQIVEAHRGTIHAENRLGSPGPDGSRPITGARFVVRLPALPDNWQDSDDD
jgi:two-component system sensor histidine kinase ChvG